MSYNLTTQTIFIKLHDKYNKRNIKNVWSNKNDNKTCLEKNEKYLLNIGNKISF